MDEDINELNKEEISYLLELSSKQTKDIVERLQRFKYGFESTFSEELDSDHHLQIQRVFDNLVMDINEAIGYYESVVRTGDDRA